MEEYWEEEFTEVTVENDDIYDEDYREALVDGGEITAEEAAFLKGYDEAY